MTNANLDNAVIIHDRGGYWLARWQGHTDKLSDAHCYTAREVKRLILDEGLGSEWEPMLLIGRVGLNIKQFCARYDSAWRAEQLREQFDAIFLGADA